MYLGVDLEISDDSAPSPIVMDSAQLINMIASFKSDGLAMFSRARETAEVWVRTPLRVAVGVKYEGFSSREKSKGFPSEKH